MAVIIGLLILFIIGIALAIPLAGLVVFSQSQAKKEAKKMLDAGQIMNERKYKQTSNILSKTTNDLEAADLWKRLQELKAKTS